MKRKNHGHVAKFVAGEGYGFIETADGRKVYFHRNSVLDDAFEHLTVGSEVHWQLTESGFEFCLQTGHVGAPCIRVAVAQKRPVLEPNRFRYAFPPCNRPTACRGDMPGGHRAGAGTEPARRTAVATAAPKGFPDEDAAWIDGLAQRLDVANQLARRVAGTTDPELAVEAVRGGAGRRHRLG
jgi:cold shock CspA family protein